MGKLQQGSAPLNIADEMRRFIASSEIGLSSISPDNVRQILSELEQANDLIAALAEAGTDVRPEAERLNSLEQRSMKQAAKIIKAFGGSKPMALFGANISPKRQNIDAVGGCSTKLWQPNSSTRSNNGGLLQQCWWFWRD